MIITPVLVLVRQAHLKNFMFMVLVHKLYLLKILQHIIFTQASMDQMLDMLVPQMQLLSFSKRMEVKEYELIPVEMSVWEHHLLSIYFM